MQRSIEDQIHATYRSLRFGAAFFAFIFPWVLWYGGYHNGVPQRSAMSDYYWATRDVPCDYLPPTDSNHPKVDANCTRPDVQDEAPPNVPDRDLTLPAGVMRTWFVGLLFAIGVTLNRYQGHSLWENIFLTVAGLLAWAIAIFPEQWDQYKGHVTLHTVCAMSFFGCIAIISGFFSRNTLSLVKPISLRNHYQRAYYIMSGLMVLSPVTAAILNLKDAYTHAVYSHYVFWIEFSGVYAFAGYWCVKTREMSCPGAEQKVIERQEHTPPPLIPGTKRSGVSPT